MAFNTLVVAARLTQSIAVVVLLYEFFTYNVVFLGKMLPLVGKQSLVPVFAVAFNLVWGLAAWSYLKAHCADPGVLPERWRDFVQNVGEALPIAPPRPEWQPGKATFCKKCDLPRPERAHHCIICDTCVLRMDHHCPWINNCVGFYNHKYFLLLGVYACLAGLVALATALPELIFAVSASWQMLSGVETPYERYDGYINAGSTIGEGTMTVGEARRRCASLAGCRGFSFEGQPTEAAVHVYFKDQFDVWSTGWTSYRLRDSQMPSPADLVAFLFFGLLAFATSALLTPMLATHLPLAAQNLTTIEDNYDNMPNPFDQGGACANLSQILGTFGPDWFLPIEPCRPISDGVSFARCDEKLGPDGLPERLGDAVTDTEQLWRVRYRVRSNVGQEDFNPLSSLARWWTG